MAITASTVPVAGRPAARGFVDESGAYIIEGVPPGNYYVLIALSGSTVMHPGVTTGREATAVVVPPGTTVSNIDIVIPDSLSGVNVRGRVTYPPGQAPIAGTQQASLSGQRTASIAADGNFDFPHVLPGSYSISIPNPGAAPARIVVTDKDVTGIEIAVPRFVVVNGTVTAEGGTRPPLSLIFEGPNYRSSVPVQPNGTFAARLPEGQYITVVAAGTSPARFDPVGAPPFAPGYYVASFSTESQNLVTGPLKIAATDSVVRMTLSLGRSPGVKVSGRFRSGGADRGPAVSRKMQMVAMATFETVEATIAEDGSFEIPKVTPGLYRATVALGSGVSSPPMVVSIPNRDVAGLEIAIPAPVEVTGRIAVDGNGPPPRFSMSLVRGGNLPVITDANGVPMVSREELTMLALNGAAHVIGVNVNALADGSFRMTLPQGDYRVFPSVSLPAYVVRSMSHGQARLFTEPLQVTDKESAELHIGFGVTKSNPWRRVIGRVTGSDSSQGPLRVVLESPGASAIETLVNPDGTFQFSSVLTDTIYTARLVPASDAVATVSVAVTDKDVEGVQLVVPRERDVTIRASVEGIAPVPTFMLTLIAVAPASGSRASALVKPEADGSFKARLPQDERRIQVSGFPLGYTVKSLSYGSVDLLKTSVKLEGAESSTINVTFAVDPAVPFGNVQGRVTGINPELRDVRLVLNGAAAFATFETTVSPNGLFSFSKIPQGTYVPTLAGDVNSGLLTPPTITVTGRDFTALEIHLPKDSVSPAPAVVPAPTGATLSDLGNLNTSRQAANESAAVANLRTINTAQVTFLSVRNGQYGSLADLIDAGLLDSTFTGTKAGFNFSVIPVPGGYSAVSLPAASDTGRYGFYTTPDAVVRYSPIPILSPPRRGGSAVQ